MAQEQKTVVASKRWNIDWRDLLNGAIMAVYGAVGTQIIAIVMEWISSPGWSVNFASLQTTAKGAAAAIAGYLFKKFTERSKIIITNPPQRLVAAVKSGDSDVKVVATIPTKDGVIKMETPLPTKTKS